MTLMAVIIMFDKMSTSAQDLILSFFGVNSLRKYPHEETTHPAEKPEINNPIPQSKDGSKKKGNVDSRQTAMEIAIVSFAIL